MAKSEISRLLRGHIFAGNPWLKWDVSPLLMRPHHCNQGPHQMMITLLRRPHLCWQSLAKSDTEKIKLIIYLHVDSTLLSFINQVFSLVTQQKRKKSSLVSGDWQKSAIYPIQLVVDRFMVNSYQNGKKFLHFKLSQTHRVQ